MMIKNDGRLHVFRFSFYVLLDYVTWKCVRTLYIAFYGDGTLKTSQGSLNTGWRQIAADSTIGVTEPTLSRTAMLTGLIYGILLINGSLSVHRKLFLKSSMKYK